MPQTAQKQPQRKRVRKRKRRNVSTSSSSSSSSDSDSAQSSSSSGSVVVSKKKAGKAPAEPTPTVEPSDSSSDSEYSDSSEGQALPAPNISNFDSEHQSAQPNATSPSSDRPREQSPGLIHPVSPIPDLFPLPNTEEGRLEEERLKERFRKFWMSSMADAFADDLNEIRTEPTMTPAKLSFIVDLLASGADGFTQVPPGFDGLDEMKIALGDDDD